MVKPAKPPADRIIKSGLVSRPTAPQAASHLVGKLIFFPGWCKKCGLCTVVCPTGALKQEKNGIILLAFPEKCELCSLCWRVCPDFAIVKNPVGKDDTHAAP